MERDPAFEAESYASSFMFKFPRLYRVVRSAGSSRDAFALRIRSALDNPAPLTRKVATREYGDDYSLTM